MERLLYHLALNLSQVLIHINEPHVVNGIVAFYSGFKKLLIIRPEYSHLQDDILKYLDENLLGEAGEVVYGDGFYVDTWDNKFTNYKVCTQPDYFDETKYWQILNDDGLGTGQVVRGGADFKERLLLAIAEEISENPGDMTYIDISGSDVDCGEHGSWKLAPAFIY